jgi:hypothetical protein
MVPGPSSVLELEGGIENIGRQTSVDQSYKAGGIPVFMRDEVDEGEPPIPSEDVGASEDVSGIHASHFILQLMTVFVDFRICPCQPQYKYQPLLLSLILNSPIKMPHPLRL